MYSRLAFALISALLITPSALAQDDGGLPMDIPSWDGPVTIEEYDSGVFDQSIEPAQDSVPVVIPQPFNAPGTPSKICDYCYPVPSVGPFPIVPPRPRPTPGGPVPHLDGGLSLLTYESAPMADVVEWQMALVKSMTAGDLCNSILTQLLRRNESCGTDNSFSDAQTYVLAQNTGTTIPSFIVWFADRNEKTTRYWRSGYESHRYFIAFALNFEMQLQFVIFNYEPLYNASDTIDHVLMRQDPNTDYIPTLHNENIIDLTNRTREAVTAMLLERSKQTGAR